jgi:hypothetical protein
LNFLPDSKVLPTGRQLHSADILTKQPETFIIQIAAQVFKLKYSIFPHCQLGGNHILNYKQKSSYFSRRNGFIAFLKPGEPSHRQ